MKYSPAVSQHYEYQIKNKSIYNQLPYNRKEGYCKEKYCEFKEILY